MVEAKKEEVLQKTLLKCQLYSKSGRAPLDLNSRIEFSYHSFENDCLYVEMSFVIWYYLSLIRHVNNWHEFTNSKEQ